MPRKKITIRCGLSPGDVLMLTAAVRDLSLSHPDSFDVAVDTCFPALWENNPFIRPFAQVEEPREVVDAHYPIVHNSNEGSLHFIHGYRLHLESTLGVPITPTTFWGDIHLSETEVNSPPLFSRAFTLTDTPYWLISTGGKMDFTAKWWIPEYAQMVVNHFRDRIQFVQFGAVGPNHHHPALDGVINLVGHTDIRALVLLMYYAVGVICPITFAMHLAAAVPTRPGLPRRRACVVTAGGREPSIFTAYTNHIFLHSNGQMRCCDNGGCWVSRIAPLEFDPQHNQRLCHDPVLYNGRLVQRCMRDLVTPDDVIRAVERYHIGGSLRYLPEGSRSVHATCDTINHQ